MKGKTLFFYVLTGWFLVSGLYGLTENIAVAIACIAIAGVFFFLARKQQNKIPTDIPINNISITKEYSNEDVSEFLFEDIKVAGVTFKNGKKNRQTILRAIKFRDKPYNKDLRLGLSYYEYENAPAYYITVNDEPIGNVPADKVSHINELMNAGKIVDVTHINVYGGGEDRSYGAKITIKIKNN